MINGRATYIGIVGAGVGLLVACGSGAPAERTGGGAGSGGVSLGSAGGSVSNGGGGGTATVGGSAVGGGGSAALAGSGGSASGAGGATGGAATGGGGGSGGTIGSVGGAGAGGVGPMGTAGGTFVMCDDHADFNGRGRCAPTGKVGAVFAFENLTVGASLTTLTATFGSTEPPGEAGCTSESIGGCNVLTCPHNAVPAAAGPAAGAITAKSSGGVMITKPGANGAYDVVQFAQPLWSPIAALAFSAAGGDTPAFGETFCGPTGVTISAPAGAPSALNINRATDLQAQWTGSIAGDLEFVFRDDTSSATASVEVQCFFTTASGQGTIGKAALAKIGAGQHTVASYTWVRKIGLAGGTCNELTAIMTNASSAGVTAPFNGTATFQ
jgi:hypothetical protein